MRITIKPFELRGFNLSPAIANVNLRVYALNYFVRQSDGVIVQPGSPTESPFYDEWQCARDGSKLLLPELALESTLDALSPAHPESLRYYAGFFDPGGNHLCAFWPRPIFALDTNPNPTTWAHVIAYNSPGVEFDWTTTHAEHYSKEEFDALLQNPPLGDITIVPPLFFDGTALWIPRASTTEDGYLAAEDFIAFSIGAGMGVISFNTRQGAIILLDTDVLAALGYTPLNRSGDTMTGPLILYGNPVTGNPLEAATRGYVDAVLGGGDLTPPTITAGPTAGSITTTGATITWTTSEASDSRVEWGTTTGYTGTPVTSGTMGTSHSLPLTGLTPGVPYHYRVISKDAANNPVTSTDHTFTTTSGADTTAPTLSAETAVVTGTSVTITWTTNELADSEVNYGATTGYGTLTGITQTSGVTTGHNVTITGLVPGTYHYQCKSRDLSPAQNLGLSASDHTFTIAAVDATAPVISAVNASGLTATGATITWTTDDASDSQVQYSVDPDTSYGTHTTTTDTGAGVMSHLVSLTGLAPGTTYHFRVKSTNAASLSNTGVTTPDTFTTPGAGTVDLLTGLVSYWKMDTCTGGDGTTTAGTTPDVLHNNDLYTYFGNGGSVSLVSSAIGLGNEVRASGSGPLNVPGSSYAAMLCSDNASQHFAGSFSIAGWLTIHVSDGSQQHCLLAKGDSFQYAFPNWEAWVVGFNELGAEWQFGVSNGPDAGTGPDVNVLIPDTPLVNTPYFLCAIYDAVAGQISLQLNNNAPVVVPFTGPVTNSASSLFSIYPGNGVGGYSNCSVDEVGLWGKALSTAEVAALWNGGAGKTHPFT